MDNASKEFARKAIAILERIREHLENPHDRTPRNQDRSDDATGDANQNIAFSVSPAREAVNPGVGQQSKTYKKYTNGLKEAKPWIDLATLTVLIIYTSYTGCQVSAVLESNRIGRAVLQGAERPYIMQSRASIRPDYSVFLEFKNSGRGPAVDLNTQINFHLAIGQFNVNRIADFPLVTDADGSRASLGPGDTGNLTVDQRGTMTPDHIKQVMEGSARIYIYGQFNYRDSFGNTYEPRFCAYFVPPSGFTMCPPNVFTSAKGHGYQPHQSNN